MASPSWPTVPTPPAPTEFRPLSLGEILDRTFAIFRTNFALIAGIGAVAATVGLVMNALNLGLQHFILHRNITTARSAGEIVLAIVSYIITYGAGAIAVAATSFAVNEIYFARTTTVREAYAFTLRRWGTYVLVVFWIIASGAWLPALFFVPAFALARHGSTAAIAAGLLMLLAFISMFGAAALVLRNLLGCAAAVVEGLAVRPAMRRSKMLSRGAKGQLFVLLLLFFTLYFIPAGLAGGFGGVYSLSHGGARSLLEGPAFFAIQAFGLLMAFFTQTLVSPILRIGTTVIYFNQRIRLEAYDLMVMMGAPREEFVPAAPAPFVPAPVSQLDFSVAEPMPPRSPVVPAPSTSVESLSDDAPQP